MLARCQRCFTRSLMLPGGTSSAVPPEARPGRATPEPGPRGVTDGESSWLAIQKASYSVIWSRTGTTTWRPRARPRTATRSSRPSGMRALHQASPLVVATVTRSPARTKRSRNRVAVSLARGHTLRRDAEVVEDDSRTRGRPRGARWWRRRPGRRPGPPRARRATSKASKLTMSRRRPSSFTTKSSSVRPGTGRPSRSRTTASTVISSTPEGKVGGAEGTLGPGRAGERRRQHDGQRGEDAKGEPGAAGSQRHGFSVPQRRTGCGPGGPQPVHAKGDLRRSA